jgi:imidazole glycerol-phosphate synthase subunit HisH
MIAIVDYGVGNLGSIRNMLKKIGYESIVSRSPEEIRKGTKLILPGVGAFDTAARNLSEYGLIPVLTEQVRQRKVPILGLCLGYQLLTRSSEEGTIPGLGWIDARTTKFRLSETHLKVPHMGWNAVTLPRRSRLFEGLEESRFYFVHSYQVEASDRGIVAAQTTYGTPFDSAIEAEQIAGAQFHPEKSHAFGMRFFKNFIENF